jgi:hypothetical protein
VVVGRAVLASILGGAVLNAFVAYNHRAEGYGAR